MKLFSLKLTAAIAMDGVIHRAGSIVQAPESVARDLLRRGRAVAHADADEAEEDAKKDDAPTREELDKALASLPGEYKDADYVVNGMRSHFGDLFTAEDEAKVRDLVKAPAPAPADPVEQDPPRVFDRTAEPKPEPAKRARK